MDTAVIEVQNLTKRYGDVEALRGVSFSVSEGEVFGLLGPNGAGKPARSRFSKGFAPPIAATSAFAGLIRSASGRSLNT
jgi:ABC-2 type transport system ATP-binding protein